MAVELGEEDPKVNLDHFVRLFVNHRSVYDIERTNFEEVGRFEFVKTMRVHYSFVQAFETLGTIGSNLLRSQRLIEVLAGAGEKMSKSEINECLATINRFNVASSPPLRSEF
jgi:hypothetical protein